MVAQRAGFTVTMFLVDVARTMGTTRTVELPPGPNGEERTSEMTNLEWALQYVKLKVQEMIYNGRKTDQCGVIVFGCEETENLVNARDGGYENVWEYIPIAQPNAGTLAKLDALKPSELTGDAIDALIVGFETQADYLAKKAKWTRKIVLITDGENPLEVDDWERTARKLGDADVGFTVVGIDFDDEEYGFKEESKSIFKSENEEFYRNFCEALPNENGFVGTCAYALSEIARPEIKVTKSVLMSHTLRLGDLDSRQDEGFEISIKTSKCTSMHRPKSFKKYGLRVETPGVGLTQAEQDKEDEDRKRKAVFAQLKMRSEYYIDRDGQAAAAAAADDGGDVKMEDGEEEREATSSTNLFEKMEQVQKEELVRGFKYGSSYVPCPDGQFERLPTKKGIDICGFFPAKNFRRELSMGEVQYIWGDPSAPSQQVALSSITQAMDKKKVLAIARWTSKDGMDPKMGVLSPLLFDSVHGLLWSHMPFADDVRKYTFTSLERLLSSKGEEVKEHPYLPTEAQDEAMDIFVDMMDLMEAGDKDEEGGRLPWYDTRYSYNPSVHRIKQAQFHSAVVSDLEKQPVPPPHPEILKFLQPPKKVLKKAAAEIEAVKVAFDVRTVPKKVNAKKKDGHAHAHNDDDEELLLDKLGPATEKKLPLQRTGSQAIKRTETQAGADSETEDEDEEEGMILDKIDPAKAEASGSGNGNPLPTPARSLSPASAVPSTVPTTEDDMDVDNVALPGEGPAPGRIISNAYPLRDFQKNLETGDVVTKAVEDLCTVISEVVLQPFAWKRQDEMIECMKVLRATVLEEDEIQAWNDWLEKLKTQCEGTPGNKDFWAALAEIGRDIGLISNKEAKQHGGVAKVSESKASKFFST